MKQLIFVGIAAGVGGFVGEKAMGYLAPHLPASTAGPGVQAGLKIGLQAASTVALYGILRNF